MKDETRPRPVRSTFILHPSAFIPAVLVALLCLCASGARAHPISITSAYVTVGKEMISVKLEIMPEDFYMFYVLTPNEKGRLSAADIRKSVERHKGFLLKYFVIQDVDGGRLRAKIANCQNSVQFVYPDSGEWKLLIRGEQVADHTMSEEDIRTAIRNGLTSAFGGGSPTPT